jgi:hypothetical protein
VWQGAEGEERVRKTAHLQKLRCSPWAGRDQMWVSVYCINTLINTPIHGGVLRGQLEKTSAAGRRSDETRPYFRRTRLATTDLQKEARWTTSARPHSFCCALGARTSLSDASLRACLKILRQIVAAEHRGRVAPVGERERSPPRVNREQRLAFPKPSLDLARRCSVSTLQGVSVPWKLTTL